MSDTAEKIKMLLRQIMVMEAYEDGAKIENTIQHQNLPWLNIDKPSWDWTRYEYRVKPEPLTLWINVDEDALGTRPLLAHREEEIAIRNCRAGDRTVKMREVTE